ncbi:ADP-ribosylglycohydrolase domain-containing protein [Sarocladium implicatum]|nr:ADP-ribosylglycohydrolase domain-containing protein [Sarocladium implicatum]
MSIPQDYLDRLYAGVLGKLVGVYLGRPFENWTYQEIQERLGDIDYYVHEKLEVPLVVIDDDVSGTFAFIRALEEHGVKPDLSSDEIGKTWLNQVIYNRSIFWWGGNGISTEHTTYLNLKKGLAAPASGSIATNGRTIAEQIGAQIFIDGWAMVAPGNPYLAADLAEAAARVSHDGEAVYAAKLWAAMEAEAFVSKNVDHLLDIGLTHIPDDSIISRMIADVRQWSQTDGDWRKTRQRIEDYYGYDKYAGICHVVPNHAIMIMSLLYGGHDFHTAMRIINTCGWDTDCNSGNVGCLVALMHGLAGFEGGPDWLGPLADRAIISSADGGYSLNNAARITYDIHALGLRLAGRSPLAAPKKGAQYHFTLPGSVQGFRATSECVSVRQHHDEEHGDSLRIHFNNSSVKSDTVEVTTETFTPLDILQVDRNYDMMASPLVYPGQQLRAEIRADKDNTTAMAVLIRLKAYKEDDSLVTIDSDPISLTPGHKDVITWTIPQSLQDFPVQVGIAISGKEKSLAIPAGDIYLHSLGWSGCPTLTLSRPAPKAKSFWSRAWVTSVDKSHMDMGPSFFLAQNEGEGLFYQGTREWKDYSVQVSGFVVNHGANMGVAGRVQGLRRYYAVVFTSDKRLVLVKVRDNEKTELASKAFMWALDVACDVTLTLNGKRLVARVGETEVQAQDDSYDGGAAGLIVSEGSLSADSISIGQP